MLKKLALILAFLILIPLGVTSPAQAQNYTGTYWAIHNQGDSGAWLDVRLGINGSIDDYDYNLLPGHTAGEPNYEQSIGEAHYWYLRVGWCAKWRIDGGTIHNESAPVNSGIWISTWEGFGDISGQHMTYVKTWNC